jgi:EAL domain-containing protein (putative c-di-GMP-specific phosphodiesterase class I)/GGDEF domain-containing protein
MAESGAVIPAEGAEMTAQIAAVEPIAISIPRIARVHITSLAKLAIDFALQPIVEVHTGQVFGYEALMRGYDMLALRSPVDLLDCAANAGSLVELERLLHARAIAKFTSVPDIRSKRIFVNLDGRVLGSAIELVTEAAAALHRQGIAPSAITVELSERHNNLSVEGFGDIVAGLRGLGVQLAVDDFGLGFSELKMLCDYGLDYLKIDGHFIRGIASNPRKRLFVSTICNLAHVLGMRVVAEGVETESDYVGARDAGCDLIQGYFVAKPTTEVSDLLECYSHVMRARSRLRRLRKTDEFLVRSEMTVLPAISDGMTLENTFELFRRSPQQSFFPVVDAGGAPRGIVHERDLKGYIYLPYGRDLLQNKSRPRSITSFITPCATVDVNTDAAQILDIFTNARGSDGVIVTENLKYCGVLSATDLLKVINEKRIQQAQDQNPLTELPGNLSISDHVMVAALDGDAPRFFCYLDFDNFKPFNDRYGFQHGDRAISLFAVLLRRHLGSGGFLGHIGGDDFFAGLAGAEAAAVRAQIEGLLEDFRRDVAKLYSAQDQAAGSIAGLDREGQPRHFPLMRCSVAVLELPAGAVTGDLNRIDAVIAKAKSAAKRAPAGIAWRVLEG